MTGARVTATLMLAVIGFIAGCQSPPSVLTADRPTINQYMKTPAVLVFSRTLGWRHDEGIAGADLFFARLTTEREFGLFTTENPRVFNSEDLSRFDLVVFNNVTGASLDPKQRAAFENWMRAGGAWIGLHGAGDGSMSDWRWYQNNLIDTRFIGHTMAPQFQTGTLARLSSEHPIVDNLPDRWSQTDEWYSFNRIPAPPGAILLVGIDESSYTPHNLVVDRWPRDLRMGASVFDHPLIWAICQPEYRGFYSALGHSFETYDNPIYRQLLSNAVDWVMASDSPECD
ncbi:MAG: ThuA domain-containing protein [Pseudomonadota bacterium]